MDYNSSEGPGKLKISADLGTGVDLDQLIENYIPDIKKFIAFKGLADYADDLIQEARYSILKASQKAPIRDPRSYLFMTVRNLIATHYRYSSHEQRYSPEEMITRCEHKLSKNLALINELEELRQSRHQKLIQIMEIHLKPEQRDILMMRHFEGLSYKEISKKLNKSETALRQTASRAIRKLRSLYPNI